LFGGKLRHGHEDFIVASIAYGSQRTEGISLCPSCAGGIGKVKTRGEIHSANASGAQKRFGRGKRVVGRKSTS
jgi:hypothetical protein